MSIYSEMKDFLTPGNWGKGEIYDYDNDTVCLLGCKHLLLFNSLDISHAYNNDSTVRKLAGIIKEQFPDRAPYEDADVKDYHYITAFNDHDATTIADIYLVLEKADADE